MGFGFVLRVFFLPSLYYHFILHLPCCHRAQRCFHNWQNCVDAALSEASLLFQSPECCDLQVCHNYPGLHILCWWKWLPSRVTAYPGQSLWALLESFIQDILCATTVTFPVQLARL